MRGFLDDDDFEPTPQPKRDTELTLGFATLLGIFFGLVILCGLCFGLGYEVGRSSASPPVTLPPGTPAKVTASSAAKPSATAQNNSVQPGSPGGDATAVVQEPASSNAGGAYVSQPIHAALPPPSPVSAQPAQQRVQPAVPSGPFIVEIAAVANPEDGDVLVNALKKHNYAVTVRRGADSLIHVRIGPFASRDDANHWRQKLLNDGYNAIVEQ